LLISLLIIALLGGIVQPIVSYLLVAFEALLLERRNSRGRLQPATA
jgi:hypothetical protein